MKFIHLTLTGKKVYSEVFKYKLTDLPMSSDRHSQMEYATFPGDEKWSRASGGLVKIDQVKPGNGGILVYYASEEINPELARMEAAGSKIIRPKLNIVDFGFIALIEDTEGNLIGLHSMK